MPSPFHQKYSSQNHKIFNETPALPDPPAAATTERKSSDATSSAPGRRRSSATSRFANLEALKRPNTEQGAARRASISDHKNSTGFVGSLWNSFTRGSTSVTKAPEASGGKDTSTLSR